MSNVLSVAIVLLIPFACIKNYAQKSDVQIPTATVKKSTIRIPISIKTVKDIPGLFPSNAHEIEVRVQQSIQQAQRAVDTIVKISNKLRTFENTARALDTLKYLSPLAITDGIVGTLKLVSPNESIRNACQDAILKISKFSLENIDNNKALYQALKGYADSNAKKETLSEEETYFLTKSLEDYKRRGLDLPEEQLKKVRELEQQTEELSLKFETNIADDNRTISVPKKDLEGLDDDFINNLKQNKDGQYILGIDDPTYFAVLQHCSVESTRKALYKADANRAYPVNEQILCNIINKRHELAQLLGFASYADLNLDSTMAKHPKFVVEFLRALLEKAALKDTKEFATLTQQLPPSVHLTANGKINPWDLRFLCAWYEKQHYDLDDRTVAEYFPMERTIDGLIKIYSQFFNVSFETKAIRGLWDKNVTLMSVTDKTSNALLGYLILDLFPRENKYNGACCASILPALTGGGPALGMIIANFPPSMPNNPSLLKRSDVETFFHEFGHALHSLLSKTKLGRFASLNVKIDFVEAPSQMFEQWLLDKEILRMISHHYKTGQPLCDKVIDTIIAVKNLASGSNVLTQGFYALLSLGYYGGPCNNLYDFMRKTKETIPFHVNFYEDSHMYCAFSHLTWYRACYYSYLYSKVIALDIFSKIKEHGLLNPEIGRQFNDTVLRPGGSKEPALMIHEFLGREPNQDAFLKDMGL